MADSNSKANLLGDPNVLCENHKGDAAASPFGYARLRRDSQQSSSLGIVCYFDDFSDFLFDKKKGEIIVSGSKIGFKVPPHLFWS